MYTDYNIGLVLDALNGTGLAQETVVAILGDHGAFLTDPYICATF